MSPNIQRALDDLNFSSLTEIQSSAIPIIRQGSDLMAQALTGSGKTAAFLIPIIERLESSPSNLSNTLILAPTRELVIQIDKQVALIGKYSNVSHMAIYGGSNKNTQLENLRSISPNIITATPGRLIDLLVNENLKLNNISTLVIDEADRMMDIEMKANIMDILSFIPSKRQSLFFSATFPLEISLFAKKLLNKPLFVASKENIPTPGNIVFEHLNTSKENKINSLLDTLSKNSDKKILIFANTIHCANFLTKLISSKEFNSINLHSQRSQHQREEAIRLFSESSNVILVATDIAARGIDIPNVDIVINYDSPKSPETRIHRAGRTGRANKKGHVINIITN